MSILQVAKVWQYEFSHAQQSIMLALADFAHDDGTGIWPSMDRVAWKTGYSKRQVQRIQKELKELGVLVVTKEATHDMPAVLKINWDAATEKQSFNPSTGGDNLSQGVTNEADRDDNMTPHRGDNLSQGVTKRVGRGDKTGSLGVTPMSPDPSFKPSYNHTPPTPSNSGELSERVKGHEYQPGLSSYQGSSAFYDDHPWIAKWDGHQRTTYPKGFLEFILPKMRSWSQFDSQEPTLFDAKNYLRGANFDNDESKKKQVKIYGWWEEYQSEPKQEPITYKVIDSEIDIWLRGDIPA